MLSRRGFLQGVGGVALVSALAACTTSRSSGLPAGTGLPTMPVPTRSGTATAGPTPLDTRTPEPGATAPASDDATLRRKIGRLLIVGFRGLELADESGIARALDAGLGGVILFDRDQATGKPRNIASPTQLRALTDSLRRRATVPLLVAIDQEGGRVARLTPAHGFPTTSSEAAIGATDDPDVARSAGAAMGQTMAAAGIDLDLAPVVDVNVNPTNPAIGALDRSFSADPSVVAAMADAEIEGLHEHRVRACLKHFPGLGSASANTDFDRVDGDEDLVTPRAGAIPDPVRAGYPGCRDGRPHHRPRPRSSIPGFALAKDRRWRPALTARLGGTGDDRFDGRRRDHIDL